MALSPLIAKSQYHVRSISLPSRPYPLIPEFHEHLCRLRARESTSSLSSLCHELNGLKDLRNCVDNLLLRPLTRQALAQHHRDKWVDELLDGSLKLLDVCDTAKDALLQTREQAYELRSSLRRRRGSENGTSAEVEKYLTSRKKVVKATHKAFRILKGMESKCSFSPLNKDTETISAVSMLREVESVTLTVLESLLSWIAGVAAPSRDSKPSGWSLLSKLMHQKRIVFNNAADLSEFEKVDIALHPLTGHKCRSVDPMQAEKVQNDLETLESSIQDLEEGIEFLSRHLIKTRVSLLNILSH